MENKHIKENTTIRTENIQNHIFTIRGVQVILDSDLAEMYGVETRILNQADNITRIEVRLENDTVWLNRHQISGLFNRDIKTIGKHINNVFSEGELDKTSTVANFATVEFEGSRAVERQIEYYDLDVIISVGYRVKSKQGTQFRIWAIK